MDYKNCFITSTIKAVIPQYKDLHGYSTLDIYSLDSVNYWNYMCNFNKNKDNNNYYVSPGDTVILHLDKSEKDIKIINRDSKKNYSYLEFDINNKFNIKLCKGEFGLDIFIRSKELPEPNKYYKLLNVDRDFINNLILDGLVKKEGLVDGDFEAVFEKSNNNNCSLISTSDPRYPVLIKELENKLNIQLKSRPVKSYKQGYSYSNDTVDFVYLGNLSLSNSFSKDWLFSNKKGVYDVFVKRDSLTENEKTVEDVLINNSRQFANYYLSTDNLKDERFISIVKDDLILISVRDKISLYETGKVLSETNLDQSNRYKILKSRFNYLLDIFCDKYSTEFHPNIKQDVVKLFTNLTYNKLIFDEEEKFFSKNVELGDRFVNVFANIVIKAVVNYSLNSLRSDYLRHNISKESYKTWRSIWVSAVSDYIWTGNFHRDCCDQFANTLYSIIDFVRFLELKDLIFGDSDTGFTNIEDKDGFLDYISFELVNNDLYKELTPFIKDGALNLSNQAFSKQLSSSSDNYINDVLGFRTVAKNIGLLVVQVDISPRSKIEVSSYISEYLSSYSAEKISNSNVSEFCNLIVMLLNFTLSGVFNKYSVVCSENRGTLKYPRYYNRISFNQEQLIEFAKDNNKLTNSLKTTLMNSNISNYIFKLSKKIDKLNS